MPKIKLFTIGFTKRTAQNFFSTLKQAGVSRIIDVRLNNVSQLAGFAKKNDLIYFLNELCGSEYMHKPQLAPTKEILDDFKKKEITWAEYERQFLTLIKKRSIENLIQTNELENACLLCSEPTPEYCHRRLVGEYFQTTFKNIEITHL
jgi:uncharacterized protein (DUF488 family)